MPCPKGVHVLIPGTCKYVTFHSKGDFVDVIGDGEIALVSLI